MNCRPTISINAQIIGVNYSESLSFRRLEFFLKKLLDNIYRCAVVEKCLSLKRERGRPQYNLQTWVTRREIQFLWNHENASWGKSLLLFFRISWVFLLFFRIIFPLMIRIILKKFWGQYNNSFVSSFRTSFTYWVNFEAIR